MDFEFPLAGGDSGGAAPDIRIAELGRLFGRHIPADDLLSGYLARLTDESLGRQSLRGYLSGSVDAVLRIPSGSGHRYVVVDYKDQLAR